MNDLLNSIFWFVPGIAKILGFAYSETFLLYFLIFVAVVPLVGTIFSRINPIHMYFWLLALWLWLLGSIWWGIDFLLVFFPPTEEAYAFLYGQFAYVLKIALTVLSMISLWIYAFCYKRF